MRRVDRFEVSIGDQIIEQGTAGDWFYMISSGRAVVTRDVGDGRPRSSWPSWVRATALARRPCCPAGRATAAWVMLSAGLLLRLSRQDFNDLIREPVAASSPTPRPSAAWPTGPSGSTCAVQTSTRPVTCRCAQPAGGAAARALRHAAPGLPLRRLQRHHRAQLRRRLPPDRPRLRRERAAGRHGVGATRRGGRRPARHATTGQGAAREVSPRGQGGRRTAGQGGARRRGHRKPAAGTARDPAAGGEGAPAHRDARARQAAGHPAARQGAGAARGRPGRGAARCGLGGVAARGARTGRR